MNNNYPTHTLHNHKNSGFTLIEVLVASVILFSSIAVVSVVYRGAFISSQKAEQHVQMSGMVPAILANIRHQIRSKGNSDHVEINGQSALWGLPYQWQANLLTIKPPAPTFSPEDGVMQNKAPRYKFWQVNLSIGLKPKSKVYTFNEVSWLDE